MSFILTALALSGPLFVTVNVHLTQSLKFTSLTLTLFIIDKSEDKLTLMIFESLLLFKL